MLIDRTRLIVFGLALAAPTVAIADTYSLATFTGQLGSSPNIKAPFAGTFTGGESITGSFVIDNTTRPGGGSGFVNVFEDLYPDAALIPQNVEFQFHLGSLNFTAADNLDSEIFGGPGIQYNNGVFNGLEFITDFSFSNNNYQLRLDGPVLTVRLLSGGFPTGNSLMNGIINTGNGAVTPFIPTAPGGPGVPEPAGWSLLILGFGGVGALMRRRRAQERSAAARA